MLNDKHISAKDYECAMKVLNKFEMKNMWDCHNLDFNTNVLL